LRRAGARFIADRTHLHHRLLDLGLNQYETVTLICFIQALLIGQAYLMRYSLDHWMLVAYGVFAIAVLTAISTLQAISAYLVRRAAHGIVSLAHRPAGPRDGIPQALSAPHTASPRACLSGGRRLRSTNLGQEHRHPSRKLFLILVAVLVIRDIPFFFVERGVSYGTAVSVIYLLEISPRLMTACATCIHVLFGFIAVVAALWVRFSGGALRLMTLDLLISLTAVTLPVIPSPLFPGLGPLY